MTIIHRKLYNKINNILKIEHRMPRMALVVVILNLLLFVILCDKKEFIINYEDYEEKIVVFVYAYLFSQSFYGL